MCFPANFVNNLIHEWSLGIVKASCNWVTGITELWNCVNRVIAAKYYKLFSDIQLHRQWHIQMAQKGQ